MSFRSIFLFSLCLLWLGGCYFTSDSPLVSAEYGLAPIPDGFAGTLTNEEGQSAGIRFRRNDGRYVVSLAGETQSEFETTIFDFGASEGVYGVQAILDGDPAYAVLWVREQPRLRLDVYHLGLKEADLDAAGIGYGGSSASGISFDSRADLIAALRYSVVEKTLQHGATIEAGGGGLSDGYAAQELLAAIYAGRTDRLVPGDVGVYLNVFGQMFTNAENDAACRTVVSPGAQAALAVVGAADGLAKAFGPLLQAHRQGSDGRDDALGDGLRAGGEAVAGLANAEISARADARLFYSRHGCTSSTAAQFFRNFNSFVQGR